MKLFSENVIILLMEKLEFKLDVKYTEHLALKNG